MNQRWHTVKCGLSDMEGTLNILEMDGWHIWPQQIHVYQDYKHLEPTCLIVCSKDVEEKLEKGEGHGAI